MALVLARHHQQTADRLSVRVRAHHTPVAACPGCSRFVIIMARPADWIGTWASSSLPLRWSVCGFSTLQAREFVPGPSYAVTSFQNRPQKPAFGSFTTWYPQPMAMHLAYALFALFIQRRFMPRLAPKIAGVLAVLITAGTALGTNICFIFYESTVLEVGGPSATGQCFQPDG